MDNQPKNTASQVASVVNLPGYKIIDVLGKGGMAVVYLAIQESIGRQVALKILAPDHTDDTFTDRFLREARIISNLTHPNIITVYDANVHQGCHYMSMEYVPGNSLRESRDKLTRKQKVDVIKQVAKALDYAGRKGYVHRDIKPENILLHEDGRAILTDFGIARSQNATKGLTVTGKVIGTPYYMSPEQTKGVKVDHRSDIYSLGIVLFQALAGHLPYDGPSFVAIGIKHLSDPIPELPKGLEIFQPIINTCMSKDPAHRYQTANHLIEALDSIDDADLDFIEAKTASAQNNAAGQRNQQYQARTIPADSMPPVVSARPKKKKSNSIIPDGLSAPPVDLDVTSSDDFKRLNKRKRWILLLLIMIITGLGYYKRTELTQFYQAELAPILDPYINKYILQTPTPVVTNKNEQEVKPVTPLSSMQSQGITTGEPTTSSGLLTPVEKNAGNSSELNTTGSANNSSTMQQQLTDQSPETIEKLSQQYKIKLEADPNNTAAATALREISNWYVLQTLNAIESNDNARARLLITQANRSLPSTFFPKQLVELENRLLRRETIENHLQQAQKYIEQG
ncbi:MAG: serine/threonine-protein kinase, partial [Thioalkalispiraceae bacterium]